MPAARVAVAVLCLAMTGESIAQETYPSRPISVVVPFGPGSQPDSLARSLTEGLTRALGQPIVIVNREGAAGTIAVESVAKAKPDGYTVGFGPPGQFTIQPHLRRDLGYRVDSFEYLCQTHVTTFVFATGPNSPWQTLAQLLDAARAAPGKLNLATAGTLIAPHLVMESVAAEAGVKFTHIPFKSVADLYTQALNGTVDLIASTPVSLTTGRGMRGLAVVGDARLSAWPDIPLLQELGFKRTQFPGLMMLGLYAPKDIPPAQVAQLRAACAKAVEGPGVQTIAERTATPLRYADGAVYTAGIMADYRVVGELIAALGVKAQ